MDGMERKVAGQQAAGRPLSALNEGEGNRPKQSAGGAPKMQASLNGQHDTVKQKRLLNRLVRDLVAFTGTAITDFTSKPPRKARDPNKSKRRLLYRRAADLSDADLNALIVEIGFDRMWSALDRYTQPQLFAAE
jgi:hypothetical protein